MTRFHFDPITILVNFACELVPIMTRYNFQEARKEDFETCLNRLSNRLHFTFCQLCMCIVANYDPTTPRGWTSDFEQCSNGHQFDLISLWSNIHLNWSK